MDVLFKVEPIETFKQVLEEVLDNLYNSNYGVSNKILDASKILKEDIKNIIFDTNLSTNEVSQLLQSKSYSDEERVKIFITLLENKKRELLNTTIVHYNCAFGETLNTFNWKFKLVCGTSDLKTLSYPLLQMTFDTVTTNHKTHLRLYEFNKDMLLKLIGSLEEFVGDKATSEVDH